MSNPPYSEGDFYVKLREATSQPISDASLAKALDALSKASQSTDTTNNVTAETKTLSREGKDLDGRLFKIVRLVKKAQLPSAKSIDDLGKDYPNLIWESRQIASEAKGLVTDFGENLMEFILDPRASADEKVENLVDTKDMMQKTGAQKPLTFDGLVSKLLQYSATSATEIKREDSKEKKELDELYKKIEALDKEIDVLVQNVVNPIVKFLNLDEGLFKSLLSGSPIAVFESILGAINSGVVELVNFSTQLKDVSVKRKRLEQQGDELKRRVKDMEYQQANVDDTSIVPGAVKCISGDIQNFSTRLTGFTCIFDQLAKESDDLVVYLKNGIKVTDPVFVSRVQLIRILAVRISDSLATFINDLVSIDN